MPYENRRKVFVSYKKSDNRYRIRDRIIGCILSAWDCAVRFDDSLTPGIDYDEEISRAIKTSDVVVLLLTEHILESDYVRNIEIKQAISQENIGITKNKNRMSVMFIRFSLCESAGADMCDKER